MGTNQVRDREIVACKKQRIWLLRGALVAVALTTYTVPAKPLDHGDTGLCSVHGEHPCASAGQSCWADNAVTMADKEEDLLKPVADDKEDVRLQEAWDNTEAVLRVPGERSAEIHLIRAQIHLRRQHAQEAIKELEKGMELLEKSPTPLVRPLPEQFSKTLAAALKLSGQQTNAKITEMEKENRELNRTLLTVREQAAKAAKERDDTKILAREQLSEVTKELRSTRERLNKEVSDLKGVNEKMSKDVASKVEQLSDAAREARLTREAVDKFIKESNRPQQINDKAIMVVNAPAWATLYINDQKIEAANTPKQGFVTPTLNPERNYYYDIRAEIIREGKVVSKTKRIYVRAGSEVQVSFDDLLSF